MHKLSGFYKPHLAEILERYRKELHLTQAEFAECLAISARSYYDLKYGNCMTSTVELILLLKLLPDEKQLQLIHELIMLTETEEYIIYLYEIDFV